MTIVADLHTKKRFLQRAFFPLGTEVCSEIGLVPPSAEVAESEQNQAYNEMTHSAQLHLPYISKRIQWYLQGAEGLAASELPVEEKPLGEHLLSFTLALMVDEGSMKGE